MPPIHTRLRNLRKESLRWVEDLADLFFPQPCAGCDEPVPLGGIPVCQRCLADLPATGFEKQPGNPVEKLFRGRIPLAGACSIFYFTRGSALQSMIHHLKYLNRPDIGHFLGRRMGEALQASGRFRNMEALVPLPLYPQRQKARGYNQAEEIAKGIAEAMQIPVLAGVVERVSRTDTQTRKNRLERWKNVSGSFSVQKEKLLACRQVLLVDDVVTTGATLEACGSALLEVGGLQLGIATLAYADR
jgi:ComF family protein